MSLSDFEILKILGEGAYGCVYKVRRIQENQEYAMKVIKMQGLTKKEKENSINEVRLLASLRAKEILRYKEAFFEKNDLHIIMEYSENGDLLKFIEQLKSRGEFLTEQQVVSYGVQLSEGLIALSSLSIIHRDLKCANIMMSKNYSVVKIGDLNVSRVTDMARTQTGTPYYSSPQIWNELPYDQMTDIWSLGCVLHQATTLNPPFKATDMKNLHHKVTHAMYQPLNNRYSSRLNRIISSCLQINPKKRPTAEMVLLMFKQLSNEGEQDDKSSSSRLPGNQQQQKQQQQQFLLKTVQINQHQNLVQMNKQLPPPQYEINQINYGISQQQQQQQHQQDQGLRNKPLLQEMSPIQMKKYNNQQGVKQQLQQQKPQSSHHNNSIMAQEQQQQQQQADSMVQQPYLNNNSSLISSVQLKHGRREDEQHQALGRMSPARKQSSKQLNSQEIQQQQLLYHQEQQQQQQYRQKDSQYSGAIRSAQVLPSTSSYVGIRKYNPQIQSEADLDNSPRKSSQRLISQPKQQQFQNVKVQRSSSIEALYCQNGNIKGNHNNIINSNHNIRKSVDYQQLQQQYNKNHQIPNVNIRNHRGSLQSLPSIPTKVPVNYNKNYDDSPIVSAKKKDNNAGLQFFNQESINNNSSSTNSGSSSSGGAAGGDQFAKGYRQSDVFQIAGKMVI